MKQLDFCIERSRDRRRFGNGRVRLRPWVLDSHQNMMNRKHGYSLLGAQTRDVEESCPLSPRKESVLHAPKGGNYVLRSRNMRTSCANEPAVVFSITRARCISTVR